jgi:hypothetical protein
MAIIAPYVLVAIHGTDTVQALSLEDGSKLGPIIGLTQGLKNPRVLAVNRGKTLLLVVEEKSGVARIFRDTSSTSSNACSLL